LKAMGHRRGRGGKIPKRVRSKRRDQSYPTLKAVHGKGKSIWRKKTIRPVRRKMCVSGKRGYPGKKPPGREAAARRESFKKTIRVVEKMWTRYREEKNVRAFFRKRKGGIGRARELTGGTHLKILGQR